MCILSFLVLFRFTSKPVEALGDLQARSKRMTSPYLDRPLIPLTVELPRLLENIEAELAREKLEASEQRRLRRRAELIHWLLAPRTIK